MRITADFFDLDTVPLRTRRDDLITADESARIHALARRLLAEIGMEVCHAGMAERLRSAGFRFLGNRVLFEPAVVDEYVEDMRRWLSARRAPAPAPDNGRLTLHVSSYSLNVHDISTGRVVPYDTERLVEMCKFVDSLADDRVFGAPPGIPLDVHPDLQPIAQYRIAALYSRQGATPVDPTSAATVGYLLDMAEVMERPIHSLPVYIPTPLRLGGESLDVVLACLDRIEHISVSSMPSTGANAPLQPFGALALAAAEVLGGMIGMRVLTGKPVTCRAEIFPFDLRATAQVFGSPENLLFQMLCADFNRFYGWPVDSGPNNIHVMSKVPDAQSAADKAAIMSFGAFLGARHFGSAGTLSLDEIFSPEQLLVDVEIRDWVQRAIHGMPLGEDDADDWLNEIRAGLQRGFVGLDTTLDHYRRYTWYPRWFERGAIGTWDKAGQPRLSERLQNEIRQRIAAHDFELDETRRREVERIYAAAQRAVAA